MQNDCTGVGRYIGAHSSFCCMHLARLRILNQQDYIRLNENNTINFMISKCYILKLDYIDLQLRETDPSSISRTLGRFSELESITSLFLNDRFNRLSIFSLEINISGTY